MLVPQTGGVSGDTLTIGVSATSLREVIKGQIRGLPAATDAYACGALVRTNRSATSSTLAGRRTGDPG